MRSEKNYKCSNYLLSMGFLSNNSKFEVKVLFIFFFIILFSQNIPAEEAESITFIAFGHVYPDYDALNLSLPLIEKENPDFVVFLGDNVHEGTEESWELLSSITNKINFPLYFVPGNHDITSQPKGKESFTKHGSEELFWNFTIKNHTFIGLNSVQVVYGGEDGDYDVSNEQVDFVKNIYEQDNKNKFIFVHHCLFYNYDNQFCNSRNFFENNNWNDGIVPIIQNETVAVFVGDLGMNEPYFGYIENNISYFGIGFSPKENQLKIPQHMLKVVLNGDEFTVTPIPIRQDLTEIKYYQRVDKEFFPLFRAFIKKNLALVLKSFSLTIILLFVIIVLLLIKLRSVYKSNTSTP